MKALFYSLIFCMICTACSQTPSTTSEETSSSTEMSPTLTTDTAETQAVIEKMDSTVWLMSKIGNDHRIFGYQSPDSTSKKMIVFSAYTEDVEGNPHHCAYGSYYDMSDLKNMKLKWIDDQGGYSQVAIYRDGTEQGVIYIQSHLLKQE
ncbi:hypothetical protein BFP72_12150 [Reichenbachiella sp. 5M10]|uniref:hypothetical protein n=1 Tax=Reichenbachiella sp. 5M10 TaxID=1889772 RepID=UPI000C14DC9A|nr:hypothetical protein [Reichenbachiella sp. 5M10]PIB36092.1 hypothetical protein BFP72_12150 [Reichenbachiella sp. 5M10]